MSLPRIAPRWSWIALPLLASVLLFAAIACGDNEKGATPAAESPAAEETPAAGGATSAEIKMVRTIRFDKDELTIAADTDVEITADNTDSGQQHNFSVYEDESAKQSLGKTEVCSAPCTETVTLDLSPGEYFFRCDVHPQQMNGTLVSE